MAERKIPGSPLLFIRDCLHGGRMLWTYHVNMRLRQRFITREVIIAAVESYEVRRESQDKYFPSYLLLGPGEAFHVLFGADVDGQNVRIVTVNPSPDEWEEDLSHEVYCLWCWHGADS